jgi:hypothetical protein
VVEQLIRNQQVWGSNPHAGSIISSRQDQKVFQTFSVGKIGQEIDRISQVVRRAAAETQPFSTFIPYLDFSGSFASGK